MHNAPPVVFPVGRFAWGRVAVWGAAALSAIGLLDWQLQTQASGIWLAAIWAGWWVCLLGTATWAPRQSWANGYLVWTGQAWFWQAEPIESAALQPVSLSVGLDTGHAMLLWVSRLDASASTTGPRGSAWLQQSAMPSKWHGFRCAVYSRPGGGRASEPSNPTRL
ncbi:MAG: hypothetical protein ACK5V9_15435 [Burkholderiales bacterium]|jgi:hypothetical protein